MKDFGRVLVYTASEKLVKKFEVGISSKLFKEVSWT